MDMKRITNRSARFVTFSKRRSGLFKKAAELGTLCAAQVAVVVFSPTGKPFSFGQSSVDAVADQFLNQDETESPAAGKGGGGCEKAVEVAALSKNLEGLSEEVMVEKEKEERLKKTAIAAGTVIGELGEGELLELKERMEMVREAVLKRISEIEIEASDSLLLLAKS